MNDTCEACDNDAVEDGLCEECLEVATYCECCKRWFSQESDKCRHVFWTDCGYGGAGTTEVEWDYFKAPFFALLDVLVRCPPWRMDEDCSDAIAGMEKEIGRHRFWTKTAGFVLSRPDLLFCRLRPDLPKNAGQVPAIYFALWRPSDLDKLDDEEVGLGFSWLRSLCAEETKEANAQTVKWIEEWRQSRREAPEKKETADA